MSYKPQQVKPKGGFYAQTKVYYDGSHYIAIPHTERPYRPRRKPVDEIITVEANTPPTAEEVADSEPLLAGILNADMVDEPSLISNDKSALAEKADALIGVQKEENNDTPPNMSQLPQNSGVKMTKKQLFEGLYKEYLFLKRWERRAKIIEAMCPYFKDEEHATLYVDTNLDRKRRNLIARRIRLTRKANLQNFNYFVMFTYDNALHTEDSFKKKLKNTLGHFCSRKSWRYIGVWERSPEKKRLHFHGVFDIPDGTMPRLLYEKSDYSFNKHRRLITVQNTYFNDRFGRCDFEKIEGYGKLGEALAYIMKYIEKSGEKIVYSKGLPQFFISDIMEDDVVCNIGMEDSKLLLYDDFRCWDEGVLVGTVGADTIKQLRKSN